LKNDVADVAAIHSFRNNHDVNGSAGRGDIGMDAPNRDSSGNNRQDRVSRTTRFGTSYQVTHFFEATYPKPRIDIER